MKNIFNQKLQKNKIDITLCIGVNMDKFVHDIKNYKLLDCQLNIKTNSIMNIYYILFTEKRNYKKKIHTK